MLTIYGDFNCPFSALANVRADALLTAGHELEWRAVQHDVTIPSAGDRVDGELEITLEDEIARILELAERDSGLALGVPPIRPNTWLPSAYFAARVDEAHQLRRRLFAALWADGRDIGNPAVLRELGASTCDADRAHVWQGQFDALPRPVTPTLVLPDGSVSRGLGALSRLAELAATTSA